MKNILSERQKELRDLLSRDSRSERAKSIMEHPELLDSINNTDPIWNELFKYVNVGGVIYTGTDLTGQQKFVRRKLIQEKLGTKV